MGKIENHYKILLFYKYVEINDPKAVRDWQYELCQKLGIKGRLIVAHEGLNVTLEGTAENVKKYVDELESDSRFRDIHFKWSVGNGNAFPKLSVKVRDEIVSLDLGAYDFSPNEVTGKYISPEELHELIHNSDEEFYIIDMRNDYEHKVGHFAGSIMPDMKNFRDLPKMLDELKDLKDKKIVTVCTGGVRCEKASGFLVKHGFKDVSQLYGGIVSYMEKYPNEDFLGKLYVFDGRVTMGFNVDSPDHVIVGKCEKCDKTCDNYVNCGYPRCNKHFVCCDDCVNEEGKPYCSDNCEKLHSAVVLDVAENLF